MKPSPRLPFDKRRKAIVEGVRGEFAENGFRGTTTPGLAKTAGVSDGLLHKHLSDKESLPAVLPVRGDAAVAA